MQNQTSRISKKALWRTYAIAFSVLIITVSASHFLADWIVKQQDQYASIINISGRQRMLSQRITGMVAEAFLEKDAAERNIRISQVDDAIALMGQSHTLLTNKGETSVTSVMSDGIFSIYYGPSPNLDEKVTQYLREARHLRDLAISGEAMEPARVKSFAVNGFGSLLKDLNSAVTQYQADAENKLGTLRTLNLGLWFFTIVVIALEIFLIFRPLARRLDAAQQELEDIAHTDPLTGCFNRRALMQSGELLWSLAKRQERSFSVVMCDIDKFKRINDTFGHGIGDEAIKEFAQTCIDALRMYDVLGRFGGEEFVLILPDTDEVGAQLVAERIRQSLESKTITKEGVSFQMTSSFGTATIKGDDKSLQGLIDRADQALYTAKESGRNRVESWKAELTTAS